MNPHLARIRLYPIKSLDPVEVHEAVTLRSGGLAHDREYCLRDPKGEILNAKRLGERIISVRSECHFGLGELTLSANGNSSSFLLHRDREQIECWLAECLGEPVTLDHDPAAGFPDDDEATGPTIISTATIEEVASWFPGLTAAEVRGRFRANLEIDGVPAFWEDGLFRSDHAHNPCRIGDVAIEGVRSSARCTVPSRNPLTGEILDGFSKLFAQRREATLPDWADRACFDHFYRLATNTTIPEDEAGKILEVGAPVIL